MSLNSPSLWIVATPLGNPGDLSPRARQILAEVDFILAEDTRRAGLLLAACAVTPKRLISFHDHNEAERVHGVIAELQRGKSAAVISDAGTPLLSDPGYRLVRACRDAGIGVSPVPGPSAALAALSASGIAPQPFAFLGFPPRGATEQKDFFSPYAMLPLTLIFFERKDRLEATLQLAYTLLGDREVCIARELTKTYEEFIFFQLSHEREPLELLGEITVILGPPLQVQATDKEEVMALIAGRAPNEKPKELARRIQAVVHGWSTKDIYRLLQEKG